MRWLAVMLLIVGLSGAARADDKALARDLFHEATRRYDLGDYPRALELFKKAYLNYEAPALLFNIAQCQRHLGDKPEAIKLYKSYLRKFPDAPNRVEVEGVVARLEAEGAQEHATRSTPPQGTLTPLEKSAPLVASKPADPEQKPIYKKWWLWTTVAVVATAGIAVGLGVGLSQPTKFQPTLQGFGPGAKTSALVSW
jgi:tetratricopeptide (TPR) repeat protein